MQKEPHVRRGEAIPFADQKSNIATQSLLLIKNQILQPKEEFSMESSILICLKYPCDLKPQ
jgi:hypothetical protein